MAAVVDPATPEEEHFPSVVMAAMVDVAIQEALDLTSVRSSSVATSSSSQLRCSQGSSGSFLIVAVHGRPSWRARSQQWARFLLRTRLSFLSLFYLC